MKEIKRFYRVCHSLNQKGLWYDTQGNFTGIIHSKFDFCANSKLQMPFDPEIVGWLSTTDTIENLYLWFPQEDIKRLQEHGYYIYEYWAEDYKEHRNHWVINELSSVRAKVHLILKSIIPA